MEKNPFLHRLMKDKKDDIVHSSAYAEAQNSEGIGAASVQSFEDRKKIEANRTTIQGYRDSRLVNDALGKAGTELKSYDAAHDASQREAIRERFGGDRRNGVGDNRGDSANNGANNTEGKQTMPSGRTAPPPTWRNPGISR